METKRVFVGIQASEHFREEAALLRKSLEHLPVRFIPDPDLHLTLAPPWDESNIHKIKTSLSQAVKDISTFEIEYKKLTFAPNRRNPSLIWVESPPNKEAAHLKQKLLLVPQKLNRVPFIPHITLARFKRKEFETFPVKDITTRISIKEHITKITLFESPHTAGAGYKVLFEIPLAK